MAKDSKESSPSTKPIEESSPLSNLHVLDDGLIEDSEFDLGLPASADSNPSPSRSPSTPVQAQLLTQAASPSAYAYANHDFNFDTSDMVLGMSGNHSVASPSLSHKSAITETQGRNEELGDFFDFFKNPLPDGAHDSDNRGDESPDNGTAALLTQPERSVASETEEDGYDVDQLLASPLPPSNMDYVYENAASKRTKSDANAQPKESEATENSNYPVEQDLKQRSSACRSHGHTCNGIVEPPCCANPQSPAASDHELPQETNALASTEVTIGTVPQSPSIALLLEEKGRNSEPVTRNGKKSAEPSVSIKGACAGDAVAVQASISPMRTSELVQVAKAASLHTTPNQEMHLPPLVKASATEKLAVPRLEPGMGGAASLGVAVRGALSYVNVAESLQRNDATVLSRMKALSPARTGTIVTKSYLPRPRVERNLGKEVSSDSPKFAGPSASSEGEKPSSATNRDEENGLGSAVLATVKPADRKATGTTCKDAAPSTSNQPILINLGDNDATSSPARRQPFVPARKPIHKETIETTPADVEKANPLSSRGEEGAANRTALEKSQSEMVATGSTASSRSEEATGVASECKASSENQRFTNNDVRREGGAVSVVSVHSTPGEATPSDTTTSEAPAMSSQHMDRQSVDLVGERSGHGETDDERKSEARDETGDYRPSSMNPELPGNDCVNMTVDAEQDGLLTESAGDEFLKLSTNAVGESSGVLDSVPGATDAVSPSEDSDSSGSSDSSIDTDDESLCGSAYMERVTANKRRNEKLGLRLMGRASLSPVQPKQVSCERASEVQSPESLDGRKRRGMLFLPPRSREESIKDSDGLHVQFDIDVAMEQLYARYPYRRTQIRLLLSLMGASIHQAESTLKRPLESNMIYAPAPIFVTGASGTGKTAIVRDVVNLLKKAHSPAGVSDNHVHLSPLIGTAYVNCATVEPTSIDAIVESAFGQLVEDVHGIQNNTRKSRKRKRKGAKMYSERPPGEDAEQTKSTTSERRHIPDMEVDPVGRYAGDPGADGDLEDSVELERKNNLDVGAPEKSSEGTGRTRYSRKVKICHNEVKLRAVPRATNEMVDGTSRHVEERSSAHAVALAFGRAVSKVFGGRDAVRANSEQSGCAFLILDNAERLLSLSSSKMKASERNNFLSQLLLLPQVLGLNLTVIAVTRSNLLEYSRINNVAPTQKALGTIRDAVRPVRIHFSAYKGKEVFKAILKQPHVKQLIVGIDSEKTPEQQGSGKLEFQSRVYESFLDILIQSLSSSTRNVRDMIQVGRLWPKYIEPLHRSQINRTLESVRARLRPPTDTEEKRPKNGSEETPPARVSPCMVGNDTLQKELLAMLDQRILPHIRAQLESGIFTVKSEFRSSLSTVNSSPTGKDLTPYSSSYDLSYLSKCLLLAAFICQANKPDSDQQLFTIQKGGKRSCRKKAGWATDGAEDVAYGSTAWDRQQQKMFRPRSFELERMLSVFVNITGLLQGGSRLLLPEGETSVDGLLRSMGSNCFFESLAQLRDLGFLHDIGDVATARGRNAPLTPLNLSCIKYWCKLTQDEAEEIAKSVDFPLSKYLM